MFKLLKTHKQRFAGVFGSYFLISVAVSALVILPTVITGQMAELAVDGNEQELLRLLLVVTGLLALRAALFGGGIALLERFWAGAAYRLRGDFARHFLRRPFSAFAETKSGETLSVYENDLPQAAGLAGDQGPKLIAEALTLLVAAGYMLWVNWWLTLIFFGLFPVLIVMQALIAQPIQKKAVRRSEARAAMNARINDSFQNTSTVAAFSLEEKMHGRVLETAQQWVSAQKAFAKSMLSLVIAGIFASTLPIFVIAVVLARQFIYSDLDFAGFVVFFALAGDASGWLQMLSQRLNNFATAKAGAKRLLDHTAGGVEDAAAGRAAASGAAFACRADNLSFSYGADEGAPLALDGVSFAIAKGRRVAFVGASGSGKTTVLKLLLRLYEPTGGGLEILGVPSGEISLEALRGAVSYVPQDSFLFPESIGANITGHESPPDMARLEKAARDAGILDFVNGHPDKWDAALGESAENISGGQKQRIAIARAFYKDSEIILFDEATSALDPATEAEVIKSFEGLSRDRTLIMVAHRVKAIRFCDEIVAMDGGKVAGIGSHDELLRTCAAYRNLYESQERGGA